MVYPPVRRERILWLLLSRASVRLLLTAKGSTDRRNTLRELLNWDQAGISIGVLAILERPPECEASCDACFFAADEGAGFS